MTLFILQSAVHSVDDAEIGAIRELHTAVSHPKINIIHGHNGSCDGDVLPKHVHDKHADIAHDAVAKA